MPYLGTFGLEYEKAIVISEISTLKFLKNESFPHIVNVGMGPLFLKVWGPVFLDVGVWVQVWVRFIKYAMENPKYSFRETNLVLQLI